MNYTTLFDFTILQHSINVYFIPFFIADLPKMPQSFPRKL